MSPIHWAGRFGLALMLTLLPVTASANFYGTPQSYPAQKRVTPFAPGSYRFEIHDGSTGRTTVTRLPGGHYFTTGVKDLEEFGFYRLAPNTFLMFGSQKGSSRILYLLVDRTRNGSLIAYNPSFEAAYIYNRFDEKGRPEALLEMFPSQKANVQLFKRLMKGRTNYPILFKATPE